MICVDTNVVIGVLNRRDAALKARFDLEVSKGGVALPAVSLFELEFGIAKSSDPTGSRDRLAALLRLPLTVLSFEAADAREAADIRATLQRAGTPIGPYDVLIAAQARCHGATLVTANTREFSRVPRLILDDWTTLM